MKQRILGKTDIELSEVGYGAAALFGKNVLGKEGITEDTAYEIIATAIKNGVTFFDTGINYGYAEERLGRCLSRAIKEGITTRSELVIETKCGETINPDGSYGPNDWSPDWIKRSLDISLGRLGLDYVDMFAMHGGTISDCTDDLILTFQNLKSQGLIKAYGINTFDNEMLEWIIDSKAFDFVMLDYNVIKQDREPLIEKLNEAGVGVIAGMALGQSLISKNVYKIKNRNDIWYLLRTIAFFRENLKKSKDFKFLTKYDGYTGNQLALRYVLDNEGISSAVFSTTNIDHLIENISATSIVMPEHIRKQIKDRA